MTHSEQNWIDDESYGSKDVNSWHILYHFSADKPMNPKSHYISILISIIFSEGESFFCVERLSMKNISISDIFSLIISVSLKLKSIFECTVLRFKMKYIWSKTKPRLGKSFHYIQKKQLSQRVLDWENE